MLALILGYQNCSSSFQVKQGLSTGLLQIDSDTNLEKQSIAILQSKCASCHGTSAIGGVTGITDVQHLISSGLITPGNPAAGRLIGSIEDGSMPTPGLPAVTPTELTTIKSWVASIRIVGPTPGPGPNPTPTPSPPPQIPAGMKVGANATLQTQALRIIQYQCAGCHQANSNLGGIGRIMEPNYLVTSGLVTMGDPNKGRLIGSIVDKTMPKAGTYITTTTAELQIIRDWVASMSFVPMAAGEAPFEPLPPLNATYNSIYQNILLPKCVMCHGPTKVFKNFRYDTYTETMRSVSAGNPGASRLFTECRDGLMPEAPFRMLNSAENAAIQAWITGGAANN